MNQRDVHVLHVLLSHEKNGTPRFFFYPHARWHSTVTGDPFLAVPTKKIFPDRQRSSPRYPIDRTLDAVLREDLGWRVGRLGRVQHLPPVTQEMTSPALRVPTTFTISPVHMPVPSGKQAALCRRLRGEWLTPSEALRRSLLSPTAQRVLETSRQFLEKGPPTSVEVPEWISQSRARTEQLLAAQRGDRESFGQLFEDLKPLFLRNLRAGEKTRALFLIAEDVEDALHNAAVNALTHLHSFDATRGSAEAWLVTIVRNSAITLLRQRGARHFVHQFLDEPPVNEALAARFDPAEVAEKREELTLAQERLAEALLAGGPVVRRAWELRIDQELSYKEAAAQLGLPVGTVGTMIHRLRRSSRVPVGPDSATSE